jgi:DNA ligase-1
MVKTFPSPMLAPNQSPDLEQIKYPTFASFKLDGIRMVVWNSCCYSRNGKALGSLVQNRFADVIGIAHKEGLVLDGEIYAEGMKFNEICSAAADPEGIKKLQFYMFDCAPITQWGIKGAPNPFLHRVEKLFSLKETHKDRLKNLAFPIKQYPVNNPDEVELLLDRAKELGTEGLILKTPDSLYKHGRATEKENTVWKVKFWATVNAVITGYKQAKSLTDEARAITTRNAIGAIDRGHKKENYQILDSIGSIELRISEGQVFSTGTVTYANFAKNVDNPITWDNKLKFIGKHVELAYQETGVVDKPRFPKIVRFRPDLDV